MLKIHETVYVFKQPKITTRAITKKEINQVSLMSGIDFLERFQFNIDPDQ